MHLQAVIRNQFEPGATLKERIRKTGAAYDPETFTWKLQLGEASIPVGTLNELLGIAHDGALVHVEPL